MLLWRHRARVVEAGASLLFARWLVGHRQFSQWSGSLGNAADATQLPVSNHEALLSRRVSRSVMRAAAVLPGHFKCLPLAMAVQWMLRRRNIASDLVLGVLPGTRRGTLDDLHAWVEVGEAIVIGESNQEHYPVLRLH